MRADKGTYILLLECHQPRLVQVGKWGTMSLQKGYYQYVGSAFGPGGIKARVGRHARAGRNETTAQKMHWHIDYVRDQLELYAAWISYSNLRKEHDWAELLTASANTTAITGFGCTDCQCQSHLFFSEHAPDFFLFKEQCPDKPVLHTFRQ